MSDNETKKTFKLGDDLISVVRELVQVAMLTGTNIVDHMRALECEISEETGKAVPTDNYMQAYDTMMDKMVEKANELENQAKKTTALTQVSIGLVDADGNPRDMN